MKQIWHLWETGKNCSRNKSQIFEVLCYFLHFSYLKLRNAIEIEARADYKDKILNQSGSFIATCTEISIRNETEKYDIRTNSIKCGLKLPLSIVSSKKHYKWISKTKTITNKLAKSNNKIQQSYDKRAIHYFLTIPFIFIVLTFIFSAYFNTIYMAQHSVFSPSRFFKKSILLLYNSSTIPITSALLHLLMHPLKLPGCWTFPTDAIYVKCVKQNVFPEINQCPNFTVYDISIPNLLRA